MGKKRLFCIRKKKLKEKREGNGGGKKDIPSRPNQ